ncbi:MAG: hypothetical protein KID00_02205 [Clostridium argentinense]|uniref:Uncharacterized protein n=1 Tax=Clostridium faecium TaxID=2762223 RepID=A0ABR8YSK7_9CLOT|nr:MULTISPECIES: hypothetical protein [Clostridium]MBD8047210.1 hypothetical protein [Clostridium faecium]MBS5822670.1 hypothetical protein [Clostridium argentinense]MDU1348408.1 hypothetical protein [Clostridium argentinense]
MGRNNNFKGDKKNMRAIGHYTKNAVENFEENIITQTNFLEKVKENTKKEN